MFLYYTVCYFTGIFYAVKRQISMLFIENEDSVFYILYSVTLHHVTGPPVMCLQRRRRGGGGGGG